MPHPPMLLWANNGNDDPCQDRELETIVRVMGRRQSKLGIVEMNPEGEMGGHDQAVASRQVVVDKNDVVGTFHSGHHDWS
jgi:hypothetical protein